MQVRRGRNINGQPKEGWMVGWLRTELEVHGSYYYYYYYAKYTLPKTFHEVKILQLML